MSCSPARFMTAILRFVLGALLVTLTTALPDTYSIRTAPGDYVQRLAVGGQYREFRLHIPQHDDLSTALPLVFAFHGSSASAAVIERETSLNRRADSMGFIVVYPEGLHRGWNIGECCRYSFEERVNEGQFVSAILDWLQRDLHIDPTRVYATGYSDGATLSYLLACMLPLRITAVAGVAGTLFEPLPICRLPRVVPVMVIHGTDDTRIPYQGRPGGVAGLAGHHLTHSASEVARFWVKQNQCDPLPTTVVAKNVSLDRFTCGRDGEVRFYTIRHGQHGWPGGERGWVFSPIPPQDMAATDSIIAFFLSHHMGGVHRPTIGTSLETRNPDNSIVQQRSG